jgi:hypothetical protein
MAKPRSLDEIQKVGWPPREWCHGSGLGMTKLYELKNAGKVTFVKVGKRTLITTSPAEFLAACAAEQAETAAARDRAAA